MSTRFFNAATVLAVALLVPFATSAATLGATWHGSTFANNTPLSDNGLILEILDGNGCFSTGACFNIFNQFISPLAAGTTFTIDAASQSDWSSDVVLLTNGSSDLIWNFGQALHGGGGGNGGDESLRFMVPGGTDFSGFTISDLKLTIDSVTYTSSGSYWGASWDLTVEGTPGAANPTAPEPGTITMLGSGIAMLSFARFQSRRAANAF